MTKEQCAAALSRLDGAVVDLDCWMWSTAISLARGVVRRAAEAKTPVGRVYAIDRFIREPWMDRYLPDVSCDYQRGESFLPEARRRLGDLRGTIELVQADLTTYVWQDGPRFVLTPSSPSPWADEKQLVVVGASVAPG